MPEFAFLQATAAVQYSCGVGTDVGRWDGGGGGSRGGVEGVLMSRMRSHIHDVMNTSATRRA